MCHLSVATATTYRTKMPVPHVGSVVRTHSDCCSSSYSPVSFLPPQQYRAQETSRQPAANTGRAGFLPADSAGGGSTGQPRHHSYPWYAFVSTSAGSNVKQCRRHNKCFEDHVAYFLVFSCRPHPIRQAHRPNDDRNATLFLRYTTTAVLSAPLPYHECQARARRRPSCRTKIEA